MTMLKADMVYIHANFSFPWQSRPKLEMTTKLFPEIKEIHKIQD
jgi:hypothetical protein